MAPAPSFREIMVKAPDKDDSLKRLGGGRWQTRDERFTIEPQSGTWVVVDAEQTDELGLALVRGPFGSLGAAKEAIASARRAEPATSPLAARAAKISDRPAPAPARSNKIGDATTAKAPAQSGTPARADSAASRAGKSAKPDKTREPEPPAEPKWLQALEPADRRRARRLIDRLTRAGATDAESIVRRDIVGDVPAAAAFAILGALDAIGTDAPPAEVARLLADGRDDDLGVRWRLVDGDGRPITLDLDANKRR